MEIKGFFQFEIIINVLVSSLRFIRISMLCRKYIIHGSKIHIESGYILLTLELRVKRLRRFDLPPADLDHAMIRVGDSAQVVVVAE